MRALKWIGATVGGYVVLLMCRGWRQAEDRIADRDNDEYEALCEYGLL